MSLASLLPPQSSHLPRGPAAPLPMATRCQLSGVADTGKLQVVSQGSGTVDSVNVTFHVTGVNGNVKAFDFGTCEEPGEE